MPTPQDGSGRAVCPVAQAGARTGRSAPGVLAAAGASWRLWDLVGEPLAKEVLLAGRVLDGEQAHRAALVTELVEPDELLPVTHALIDRVLRSDLLALRLTKPALHAPPGAHLHFDDVAQAVLLESEEKQRRMTDFLEKGRS